MDYTEVLKEERKVLQKNRFITNVKPYVGINYYNQIALIDFDCYASFY